MAQLTLTLPDDLARQAEEYARQTGQSLAEVIEAALKKTIQPPIEPRPLSPQVQALFGSLKAPAHFDYKGSLTEALQERYGSTK